MEVKNKKRLIIALIVFLNLSFLAVVADICGAVFNALHTKLFNVEYVNIFRIKGLDFTINVPTWPVLFLIIALIFYLICLRILFRFIRKCIKAQVSK